MRTPTKTTNPHTTILDAGMGKTLSMRGESLQLAIDELKPLGIAGVLASCGLPERISDAMPILAATGLDTCGGYANAFTRVPTDWLLGGDKETDGRLTLRDDLSSEHYNKFVAQWVEMGANIVGGCCGTTAKHPVAISQLLAGD